MTASAAPRGRSPPSPAAATRPLRGQQRPGPRRPTPRWRLQRRPRPDARLRRPRGPGAPPDPRAAGRGEQPAGAVTEVVRAEFGISSRPYRSTCGCCGSTASPWRGPREHAGCMPLIPRACSRRTPGSSSSPGSGPSVSTRSGRSWPAAAAGAGDRRVDVAPGHQTAVAVAGDGDVGHTEGGHAELVMQIGSCRNWQIAPLLHGATGGRSVQRGRGGDPSSSGNWRRGERRTGGGG